MKKVFYLLILLAVIIPLNVRAMAEPRYTINFVGANEIDFSKTGAGGYGPSQTILYDNGYVVISSDKTTEGYKSGGVVMVDTYTDYATFAVYPYDNYSASIYLNGVEIGNGSTVSLNDPSNITVSFTYNAPVETPSNVGPANEDEPVKEDVKPVEPVKETNTITDNETGVKVSGNINGSLVVNRLEDKDLITFYKNYDVEMYNAYDIKVDGSFDGKLAIKLPIDEQNKDALVYVIHQKHDGSFEVFEDLSVVDGYVTVLVDELSPFLVTLDNPNTPSDDVVLLTTGVNSNTGNYTWVIVCCSLIFVGFVGYAGYSLIKKYKEVYVK